MGTKWGEHAHHSRRAVTSTLDPEYEYKDVLGVAANLKTFEDWLVAYKHKVRCFGCKSRGSAPRSGKSVTGLRGLGCSNRGTAGRGRGPMVAVLAPVKSPEH